MCRWAAYTGEPIFIEDIVSRPAHSLIRQAQGALRCHTPVNADGFGLAWYGERPEPGLYRDILPAWSDPNLRSIVSQVRSRLFMAHVRASTGTATSRNNCHPFAVGRWSFMHNGQFGGYVRYRREVEALIPDALYAERKGWDLGTLEVAVEMKSDGDRRPTHFAVEVTLPDGLDEEQRRKLLVIAGKCPVHRLLEQGAEITVAERARV